MANVTPEEQAAPDFIPFNRPTLTGAEHVYVDEVMQAGTFAGGGLFSQRCNAWLQQFFGASSVLTTSSGTHALKMAALLCDLKPGDEVILPSYSFSSTATAFVRCGASLVFVDVEPSTMNIDPHAVEAVITPKTRVIVALHYAGVACDMDRLWWLAQKHGLLIVEDAAQAIFASYQGKLCGTLGTFGCLSFHETKNVQCGEGGGADR
jgi:dTDP-4-amino-4,6-dideoxygalactose transaminase